LIQLFGEMGRSGVGGSGMLRSGQDGSSSKDLFSNRHPSGQTDMKTVGLTLKCRASASIYLRLQFLNQRIRAFSMSPVIIGVGKDISPRGTNYNRKRASG
jgi:hypothetical protein